MSDKILNRQCRRADGNLNIHAADEPCEVCRPTVHSCEEWREAIVGCAACHEQFYDVRERYVSERIGEMDDGELFFLALRMQDAYNHPVASAGVERLRAALVQALNGEGTHHG